MARTRTETGQGAFSVADPRFWKSPLLDDFHLSFIISCRFISDFQTMIRTKFLMYGGTALAAPILFHRVHAAGEEAGGQKRTKCRPSQVFRHSPLIVMQNFYRQSNTLVVLHVLLNPHMILLKILKD